MQNIRIGVVVSSMPVGVKPSSPDRWPSWKIQTIAPNVAVRLSMLSTSALTGTSTLPNMRNSSTNVTPAMSAEGQRQRADQRRPCVDELRPTAPPTSTANGAATARTACTSARPRASSARRSGTTDSHVPRVEREAGRERPVRAGTTPRPAGRRRSRASTRATPGTVDSAAA